MNEENNPFKGPTTDPGAVENPQTAGDNEPIVADNDARMWGTLCHLSALSMYFTAVGGIVGPLAVWLVKRNEYPFVDDQGKESLNFQLSMLLYHLIAAIGVLCLIGLPALICLSIANIVFVIIASLQANNGVYYRYPLTIRFIK